MPLSVVGDSLLYESEFEHKEYGQTSAHTGHGTPEDLGLLTWTVQRSSRTPLAIGDVIGGLLFSHGQLAPRHLHSLLQIANQCGLVGLRQSFPSGLQLVDVGVGQRSGSSLGHGGVEAERSGGSSKRLTKHFVYGSVLRNYFRCRGINLLCVDLWESTEMSATGALEEVFADEIFPLYLRAG